MTGTLSPVHLVYRAVHDERAFRQLYGDYEPVRASLWRRWSDTEPRHSLDMLKSDINLGFYEAVLHVASVGEPGMLSASTRKRVRATVIERRALLGETLSIPDRTLSRYFHERERVEAGKSLERMSADTYRQVERALRPALDLDEIVIANRDYEQEEAGAFS